MYYIIYLSLKAARDISIGVHNPFPIFLFRFLPFISPFHCAATTTSWGTTLLDPLPNPPAAAEEAEASGGGELPRGHTYSVSSPLLSIVLPPVSSSKPLQSQIHRLLFGHFWVLDWFRDQFIDPSPFPPS